MLKVLRWLVGRCVLFVNWVSMPSTPVRTAEEQSLVDAAARSLTLYEFLACPFCVKVRRELRRLGVDVERRDAARVPQFREELLKGGGEVKVPCLRIEEGADVVWLYESSDIVRYLQNRFSLDVGAANQGAPN